jgi:hypothetical protein
MTSESSSGDVHLLMSSGDSSTSSISRSRRRRAASLATVVLLCLVLTSCDIGYLATLIQRDTAIKDNIVPVVPTASVSGAANMASTPAELLVDSDSSHEALSNNKDTTRGFKASSRAPTPANDDEKDAVYPSEEPIMLQHQQVGTVSRLCTASSCWLLEESDQWHTCNNNGPKAIPAQPWMIHPELSSTTSNHKNNKELVFLYYGSHNGDGTETIRALVSSSQDTNGYYGPFEHMNISVPPFTHCESIHSPSLFVDNDKQKLYM